VPAIPVVTRAAVVTLIQFATLSTACQREAPAPAAAPADTASGVALSIDGAVNRGTSIAARGQDVVVTWAATTGEATDIYTAASDDGGRTFSDPVRVNDVAGDARVSAEQPPRVAMGSTLAVVWQSRRGDEAVVRLATSKDSGRSFLPAVTVNNTPVNNPRGWSSVAISRDGQPLVLWLDARTGAPAAGAGAGEHAHHGSGEHAGGMQQSVFFAAAPGHDTRVAQGACFCCKTSIVAAGDGSVYAAWRHVYPVNLRDMAVARSTDGGKTFGAPVRVSEDHWQIDACPEDGPAIAADPAGVLHIAWPTFLADTGRKAVFYSYSTDGGRTFAPRIRVDADDTAPAAHPQIAVDGDRVTIVWDETAGKTSRVRSRSFARAAEGRVWNAERSAAYVSAEDVAADHPSIALAGGRAVISWTETDAGGRSTVRVAPQ
jgi:hypothetical protein